MTPLRIQRRRTRGYRTPPNTAYVGRPSKWGNPHKVGISLESNGDGTYRRMTGADAVARYRDEYLPYWTRKCGEKRLDPQELRGKNLACFCRLCDKHSDGKPLDVRCADCAPCHVDPLGELANGFFCQGA
jgi:hypothetical protein